MEDNERVSFRIILYGILQMIPIGDVLKRLHAQKHLSLRLLGEEVGISFNTLAAYERNLVQPTIENCYKLSRFFEVPMEHFILGEKADKLFRDPELLALFHDTDELQRPDRQVIKAYIRKCLNAKAVLKVLAAEAEEKPQVEEKKSEKKRLHDLNRQPRCRMAPSRNQFLEVPLHGDQTLSRGSEAPIRRGGLWSAGGWYRTPSPQAAPAMTSFNEKEEPS